MVQWEVERLVLNGRIDAGDSGKPREIEDQEKG